MGSDGRDAVSKKKAMATTKIQAILPPNTDEQMKANFPDTNYPGKKDSPQCVKFYNIESRLEERDE